MTAGGGRRSGNPSTARRGTRPVSERTRAGIEELFFDLVFVLAFIQVTALVLENLSATGVLKGLLVLALLWWSWSSFAWLSNNVQSDWGLPRLVMYLATVIAFVMAVSTRHAFTALPGGLHGPVVFAVCYGLVRLVHVGLYAYVTRAGRRVLWIGAPAMGGAALLLCAALLPQRVLGDPHREDVDVIAFWACAVLVDYVGSLALPLWQWRVYSAKHWAERHGLIVIVALGESIILDRHQRRRLARVDRPDRGVGSGRRRRRHPAVGLLRRRRAGRGAGASPHRR